MASISIGQTPIQVANLNLNRVYIRFQNAGDTVIYLQRIPLQGAYSNVSPTSFEVVLVPLNSQSGSPEVFETRSMLAYQAVAGPCCNIYDPCERYDNKEDKLELKSKSTKTKCNDCCPCLGLLVVTEVVKKRIC